MKSIGIATMALITFFCSFNGYTDHPYRLSFRTLIDRFGILEFSLCGTLLLFVSFVFIRFGYEK